MNRHTALSITFVALNLMACCCGGVGPRAPKPPIQPVNAGDGVAVAEKKSDPVVPENPIQNKKQVTATALAKQKELDAYLDAIAPEPRRKEIFFAYTRALDQARRDPQWIAADKASDLAIRMKDLKEFGRQVGIMEKVDRAYLKKVAFDPYGISDIQVAGIVQEAFGKGWLKK